MQLAADTWDMRAINLPYSSTLEQHNLIDEYLFNPDMREVDYEVVYVPGQPSHVMRPGETEAPVNVQLMAAVAITSAERGGFTAEEFQSALHVIADGLEPGSFHSRGGNKKVSRKRSAFMRTAKALSTEGCSNG